MASGETKTLAARVLDAAILGCVSLFALAAPHSIAGAQAAAFVGLFLWVLRFFLKPRPKIERTPIDYFLLGFFILTGLTAFLSYDPAVSVGKLRAASLFTIVYLVVENVRSLRIARLLAITLISSCMINVIYTAAERALGRGVKVYGVAESSSLHAAGVREGDTLLKIDGEQINEPQDIVNGLSRPDPSPAQLLIYRHEWQPVFKVERGKLLPGDSPSQQLGIQRWSRGRDWRAAGFFGHYVTYAEVLQLIFALAVGLFVALPNKKSRIGVALAIAMFGFVGALMLTVTRAVWVGALLSTFIVLLLSLKRRTLVIVGLLCVPVVIAGLVFLQQKRNVGFFDRDDGSTTWRQIVWREGFQLLISKPRHLLVGVGMDSIKSHWRQWGMFAGGKLPRGHMHSNLLQIALERGVIVLLLWLAMLFVYARTLWRMLRNTSLGWMERGIVLGGLGGLAGFFVSGLVHYNWGDSEVVMVFYFIMGLVLAIATRHVPVSSTR